MLTLVHDRDRLKAMELPPAGGEFALLPGPAFWVSPEGRVVDANLAAIDLLLGADEASGPLRDAIVATLADRSARQVRVTLNRKLYFFQIAMSVAVAEPHALCAVAVGQAVGADSCSGR